MAHTNVQMSEFAQSIFLAKYSHDLPGTNGDNRREKETWEQMSDRVASAIVKPYLPHLYVPVRQAIENREFIPGGRYMYAAGRRTQQVNSCFLFRARDSREGWAHLQYQNTHSLMTGGGVGVVYSDVRPEAEEIVGMGGHATGPLSLMQIINEAGRHIRQGDSRRSAIWSGLHWWHPDAMKFIHMKNWPEAVRKLKQEDYNFPATMDGTNISIILDQDFFDAYYDPTWSKSYKLGNVWYTVSHKDAVIVYWATVEGMLQTGEPGFSMDFGEALRNACCEIKSADDADMCNLASLNMGRVKDLTRFAELCDLGTAFLLCGTLASYLPIQEMYKVREKNRRLGLGLMGLHEWLLKRGKRYGPDDELEAWMLQYQMTGAFAARYADKLSVSRPVATRAVAPVGTISLVAETTSGVEPMFAAAYWRRYFGSDGKSWKAQCVVDPVARRLVEEEGVDPNLIEDAYTLAEDVERRMDFQVWLQRSVDHSIASTINLPKWGSSLNNPSTVKAFGEALLKRLPHLQGITTYPDGSRGGQPYTRMSYTEATKHLGKEYEATDMDKVVSSVTDEQMCLIGSCKTGLCGE